MSDLVVIGDDTPAGSAVPPGQACGLVPRDIVLCPPGYYASAAAVEIPLIPWEEMPDRIADMVRDRSRLSDVWFGAGCEHYDQNGQGYCATADTEVLTEKGWVAYPDYNWSDPIATVSRATHRMEFQVPFQRHVYEYDGPMIYSTNRRLDFGVTPDHEMYVRRWDERARTLSPNYSFVRAGDLGWYAGLLPAPSGWLGTELVEVEVPGDRRYDGDDFLAILGLIVSDGYAGGSDGSRPGNGTRNWVSFASFREETRPAIAALAARVGFRESPSRRGVFTRYDAGALAEWVRVNCYAGGELGARAKRVPELVKVASERQIKLFLHYFDDRNRAGTQFYSTSKRLIDDIQELFLRVGRRSTIGAVPPKVTFLGEKEIRSGSAYTLTVATTDQLCLERKKHIETDRYKGLVYCAGVPNHTLLTRRNGSVLVSSNCWAYSTCHALTALRAVMNQPTVKLSPHGVACKVKNFRDEGGWSALSLDFVTAHGVPSQAVWPAQSMSRDLDNAATWADAKKYRVTEGWVDLQSPVYDRDLSFHQVLTCLLSRVPVAGDFNFWGHAVCLLDPVDVYPNRPATDPSRYGVTIMNSWGGWGDRGMGLLKDSRARPDNAVAPRAAVAS